MLKLKKPLRFYEADYKYLGFLNYVDGSNALILQREQTMNPNYEMTEVSTYVGSNTGEVSFDINNLGEKNLDMVIDALQDLGVLGKFLRLEASGFVSYPVYKLAVDPKKFHDIEDIQDIDGNIIEEVDSDI